MFQGPARRDRLVKMAGPWTLAQGLRWIQKHLLLPPVCDLVQVLRANRSAAGFAIGRWTSTGHTRYAARLVKAREAITTFGTKFTKSRKWLTPPPSAKFFDLFTLRRPFAWLTSSPLQLFPPSLQLSTLASPPHTPFTRGTIAAKPFGYGRCTTIVITWKTFVSKGSCTPRWSGRAVGASTRRPPRS